MTYGLPYTDPLMAQTDPNTGIKNVTDISSLGAVRKAALSAGEFLYLYESNRYNNNRVNAVQPSANIVFGASPAAGTVGYANSGVSSAGFNMSVQLGAAITNVAPAQAGATVPKPFRVCGGMVSNSSSGVQGLAAYTIAGNRMQAPGARLVFVTDEPKPVLSIIGYSSPYVLNVNDGSGWKTVVDSSIATLTNAAFTGPSGGGFGLVQLDFTQVGGRKPRIFEIILRGDSTVGQVGIAPASTYYDCPATKQVLWFTDSLGFTSPTADMKDCYPNWVADIAGWRDAWALGEGGTGFIANSSGVGRTHIQKLQNAQTFPQLNNVGLVYFQCSVNDPSTPAAVADAAATAVRAAIAAYPGAIVVVAGPTAANTTANQSAMVAMDQAVGVAITGMNLPNVAYVPTMASVYGQAITGTGNVQSPAGNGNADIYFNNSDGTHFNTAGHQYWGQARVLPGIMSALRGILTSAKYL